MNKEFFDDRNITWTKLLLIMFIVLIIALSVKAFSSPFLVCDWTPQTIESEKLIYYEVVIDPEIREGDIISGTVFQSIPQKDKITGNVRLKYDLVNLTLGMHIITVRAVNRFDLKSDIVIMELEKKYPSKPINITVIK